MIKTLPFNEHVAEYEEWYRKYPFVFQSEVEARFRLLFISDFIRSPNVPITTIIKAILTRSAAFMVVKKYEVKKVTNIAQAVPPKLPSQFFLGKMRLNK